MYRSIPKNRRIRLSPPEKQHPARKESGFTLIEIMLAISLAALLLTAVYWTYFSINRSIEIASEGQESFEAGRILLDLVKKDIRGVVSGKYPLVGKTETIEGVVMGEISFVTTSHLGAGPLTVRKVGYALIKDERGEKVLIRKESGNLKGEMEDAAVAELSRLVKSFDLAFYNGTEWVNQWDSAANNSLPRQIRIIFDMLEGRGSTRTFRADEVIPNAL